MLSNQRRCLLAGSLHLSFVIQCIQNVNDKINPNAEGVHYEIKLYPNPVQSQLMLSFLVRETDKVKILICDVTGRKVLNIKIPKGQLNRSIDVQNLSAGFYYLHFYVGNEMLQLSFVKINE